MAVRLRASAELWGERDMGHDRSLARSTVFPPRSRPGDPRRIGAVPLLVVGWLAAMPSLAGAQLPQTRLFSLFPSGGQVGSTVEVTVTGGADLDEMSQMLFSDPAITAVPIPPEGASQPTPAGHVFVVTIPAGVQPGICDVRVAGRFGVSNPRSFDVGTLRECLEVEPNDAIDRATVVELNVVVNGRSGAAADLDLFRFHGEQHQRVLAACHAAAIDSRMRPVLELFDARGRRLAAGRVTINADALLDAVLPATGEYFLKVYDGVYGGGEAYFYRLQLHNQPHIDFVLPPAGLPGSTGIYSLFGRNLPGGSATDFTVAGSPLEKLDVAFTLPADESQLQLDANAASFQAGQDQCTYTLETPGRRSNPGPIHFAAAPVVAEAEPNDFPETVQRVDLPVEIAGQFQSVGDVDLVQFAARAQQVIWIDVLSQRDGSAADPYLVVQQIATDERGRETGVQQVAAQDDVDLDLLPQHFSTRSDDVTFRFVAPADGQYRISLHDRYYESRGDPALVYRLAIRGPQPDFRLVVVPVAPRSGENGNTAAAWPIGLRQGDHFAARVLAFRRDGFDGPIRIEVDRLPAGVTCEPVVLEPGQSQAALVFAAAEDAPPVITAIRVTGKAEIPAPAESGSDAAVVRPVMREARAGTIVWDGDAQRPAISRVARELVLSVMPELAPLQVLIAARQLTARRDQTIELPVKLAKRNGFDNEVTLSLEGLPQEVRWETAPIAKGATEGVPRIIVPANAPQGTFPLLLRAQAVVSYARPAVANKADASPAAPQDVNVVAPALPIVLRIE